MARVTRRVASTVTLILAVVALGACGGGTSTAEKNAYARKVNAAQTKFASTATMASQGADGDTSLRRQQQTVDVVGRYQEGMRREGIDARVERHFSVIVLPI